MRKSFIALFLVAALLLTGLLPAFAGDAETIKIGGLAPLTGPVAQYGLSVQEGVDLYIQKLNEAGGIDGTPVEMIWLDEKGDPTEAVNAYNRLVEQENVVAIIGDVTTGPTLAVAELAAEIGLPMITASATAFEVTEGKPNMFRTCFLDPFQAGVMANFANEELSAKKVAVIYDNGDDYSLGLAEAFKAQAEVNGQEVVAYEAASAADVDFKSQLTTIAAAAPDALYVAFYYTEAALIVSQASEVGLEVKFLGGDGIGSIKDSISDVSLLNNTFFYSDHFAADADTETVVNFIADFNAAYGKDPSLSFSATGYDAALVLTEAIKNAGTTESGPVVEALKATNVEGVTGNLTFDDHNDPIKSAFVMTFVDGKQVFQKLQTP